jgi:hypothetical protein
VGVKSSACAIEAFFVSRLLKAESTSEHSFILLTRIRHTLLVAFPEQARSLLTSQYWRKANSRAACSHS